jgi:ribosome-binding protein aMBF1 (putative translation factor)
MTKKKSTRDAVEILHRHFVENNPAVQEALHAERANHRIAKAIAELRRKLGLSQQKFADLVGTTASVICRLENADYEGHSTSMLEKIAAAVEHKVELRVQFVPLQKPNKPVTLVSTRRPKKAKKRVLS